MLYVRLKLEPEMKHGIMKCQINKKPAIWYLQINFVSKLIFYYISRHYFFSFSQFLFLCCHKVVKSFCSFVQEHRCLFPLLKLVIRQLFDWLCCLTLVTTNLWGHAVLDYVFFFKLNIIIGYVTVFPTTHVASQCNKDDVLQYILIPGITGYGHPCHEAPSVQYLYWF